MRAILLSAVSILAACGYSQEDAPPLASASPLTADSRCTAYTKDPSWECCDDDSLLCRRGAFVVCVSHRWQVLTEDHCRAIASDPRRPELRNVCSYVCQDQDARAY